MSVRPTRLRHLQPIAAAVGGFALACLVAAILLRPLDNPDTFFHLRIGRELASGDWSLWHPGHFSRFSTHDWVSTQWLSQVLMSWAEDAAGRRGVAVLACTVALALLWVLWSSARRWTSALLATLLTAAAVAGLLPYLSPRPQVASYLLLAITTTAWLRTAQDGRARWWLVPLTWLWAMLHGMWPAAILAGAVSVIGQAVDHGPSRFRLLWVPAASALAAALTPLGPRLYAEILLVGRQAQFFGEWGAPELLAPKSVAACGLAVVGLGLALVRRPPWSTIGLLAAAALWCGYSWRTQPAGVAMLVPIVASQIGPLLPCESTTRRRDVRVAAAVAALVAVAGALALAVLPDRESDQTRDLDALLAQVPAESVLVTDWGWGGYVAWARPDVEPTMHGYGDMFTIEELRSNDDLGALESGWDEDLAATGARLALLRSSERLTYALEHHEGWSVLDRAGDWVLLRAP